MNSFQTLFIVATATPMACIAAPMPPVGYDFDSWSGGSGRHVVAPVERSIDSYLPRTVDRTNLTVSEIASFAPVSASIEALDRLRKFQSWGANWDGENAPPPKKQAIESATIVLGLLEDVLVHTPSVTLNAHGEPMFMLVKGSLDLSVTIPSPKTIHFYVSNDEFEDGGSARFNGEHLPKSLATALRKAGMTYA